MMIKVAILVFAGVQALDVAGPLDVFSEANSLLPSGSGYETKLIGPSLAGFRASNGMLMAADETYQSATGPYDLLLVAGGPNLPHGSIDSDLIECIRRLAGVSKIYGSICTGAFCLGSAGLLDGRRATTHWQNAEALAARYPDAEVDFDRIYLKDGNMITSAGVTAGIDLTLAMVRDHFGARISLAVAKRLVVVAQRQGGQSQFSPYVNVQADEPPIASAIHHVLENLQSRLSVGELATVANMSTRNFARLFVEQTQLTPSEFVERARIDRARNLLEADDKPLKVVAHLSGFGTVKRLRQAFVKRLGVSPLQYRQTFLVGS